MDTKNPVDVKTIETIRKMHQKIPPTQRIYRMDVSFSREVASSLFILGELKKSDIGTLRRQIGRTLDMLEEAFDEPVRAKS